MSHHIEKQFRNTATTPMIVSVAACVDEQGIVREIHPTGGVVGQNDIQRAEQQRMHRWIRDTFIGQHKSFFNAHNEKVPAPSFAEKLSGGPEIHIVNAIDFSPDAIVEAMKGTSSLIERIIRGDFSKGSTQTTKGAASDRSGSSPEIHIINVSPEVVAEAMKGSTASILKRILRRDFSKGSTQTTAGAVPGNPYAKMAAELHNVSFKPARERRVGMPPELGMGYGLVESLFRDFIENVPFDGSEQPPAAEERYVSVISGSTYTVVDVRRKLYSKDYYVTMERDGDKHRTKFTYRDHATWLSVWRPADDEGNARETVEVERRVDAGDAMRQVGEASAAGAGLGRKLHEAFEARNDAAASDFVRIFGELHRRLPEWDKKSNSDSARSQIDLAIRAIRTLVRQRDNAASDLQAAYRENDALKQQNKSQLAIIEVRNKEVAKLKQERGGAWDAARVRREQDTMRELLRHYMLLFVRHHGKGKLKKLLATLDADTLAGLPQEHFMLLVTKCEAHSASDENYDKD